MFRQHPTLRSGAFAIACLFLIIGLQVAPAGATRLAKHIDVTSSHKANTQGAPEALGSKRIASTIALSARRQPGDTTPPPPENGTNPSVGCGALTYNNGSFDGVNGLASEINTSISAARTADDIVFANSATICEIKGQLLTDVNPQSANVEIYNDSGGSGPVNAAPIATYAATSVIQVGTAFGYPVLEFTFPVPSLALTAGKYWICPVAVGTGSGRGFLATTMNGVIANQGGYFQSAFFGQPNWVPCTTQIANSDFAFSVSYTESCLVCPPDQLVSAADANGVIVNYPPPTATDCGGQVTCTPPSGSLFPVGTTDVTCSVSVPTDPNGGGGDQCSFNVTVRPPFDGCCIDDGTGDIFRQIVAGVPPGSQFYGFWQYEVAATHEIFEGTANRVSYRPGLSLIMDDNVSVNYAMHAEIDYARHKCRVQVTDRPTLRRFVLRDRDITNNRCAPGGGRSGIRRRSGVNQAIIRAGSQRLPALAVGFEKLVMFVQEIPL